MSILDLIARLEAATDGFWSVSGDDEIRDLVGADLVHTPPVLDLVTGEPAGLPLSYGSSADAALTLVPDGWRVTQINELPRVTGLNIVWFWRVELRDFGDAFAARWAVADAATLAIAICIAALKAREASR